MAQDLIAQSGVKIYGNDDHGCNWAMRRAEAGPLNPAAPQENIQQTTSVPGNTKTVSPPATQTNKIKQGMDAASDQQTPTQQ